MEAWIQFDLEKLIIVLNALKVFQCKLVLWGIACVICCMQGAETSLSKIKIEECTVFLKKGYCELDLLEPLDFSVVHSMWKLEYSWPFDDRDSMVIQVIVFHWPWAGPIKFIKNSLIIEGKDLRISV